ncbi:MAG: AAA family ATPase [Gammaproteobacteria bacterium]|nr:AAA family ATPase [Gammaproteobacteria bacterium]MBU1624889.1 AAA family ATPase [Gammaproteobacteria bacterium]MBU1982733.1 AAA family ATPase [Gammaproteobacteria bacterium]
MYLEHFGLDEPPFKITPVTDFFFSGANRGEILDALVYAITDGEGIIKISGEVGSGKTMLCRMLLDKLPTNIKAIYLANPSMSRDELLYAIADRLQLDLEGKRVNVILQTLQNHLETMYERGERVVVLVDEAHAMPLETLEELRLLYNLQVGKHKLLQIVLFGQPELDEKLAQTNMRQLKDRIVHHFTILPLSPKIVHAYLMFRMRAAGYKGPDIFSANAEKQIGKASQGLMRRVNILADKSLLAAFVENTHKIEERHVQAALRDSEMTPMRNWSGRRYVAVLGGLILFAAILVGAGWFFNQERMPEAQKPRQLAELKPVIPAASAVAVTPAASAEAEAPQIETASAVSAAAPVAETVNIAEARPPIKLKHIPSIPPRSLLQQRLDATEAMLNAMSQGNTSIQLFYTTNVQPARMEGFLRRARKLGKLEDIFIIPIELNGQDAFRVLYGSFPSSSEARAAIPELPARYLEAFAPTLHLLESYQNTP